MHDVQTTSTSTAHISLPAAIMTIQYITYWCIFAYLDAMLLSIPVWCVYIFIFSDSQEKMFAGTIYTFLEKKKRISSLQSRRISVSKSSLSYCPLFTFYAHIGSLTDLEKKSSFYKIIGLLQTGIHRKPLIVSLISLICLKIFNEIRKRVKISKTTQPWQSWHR